MNRMLMANVVVAAWLTATGVQAAYVRQLGPTGLSGLPSATEIVISKVAKGSPADGTPIRGSRHGTIH